jgi:ATP-dependent exoDNAse (exonuclease V) alpha subunit
MLYVAASRARQSVHVVWCCPPDRVEYLRNSLLKCGHDYMSNIPEVVKREQIRARLREFTEKSKNNKKKY